MSDKLEDGLKLCADTKRALAEWERRKKAAEARSQTEKGRAWREWVENYNARLNRLSE
jgi:hypothetical protein